MSAIKPSRWGWRETLTSTVAGCYFAVVCIGQHNWLALGILASHAVALAGWAFNQNMAADAFEGWEKALDMADEALQIKRPTPAPTQEGA